MGVYRAFEGLILLVSEFVSTHSASVAVQSWLYVSVPTGVEGGLNSSEGRGLV